MAISMQCWSKYSVVADTSAGTLFSDLPDSKLRQLAEDSSARHIAGEVTTMESGSCADSLTAGKKRLRSYAFETFVWDLAVRTSRGRVPEGTLLDVPVYLRRWPNFTRLTPIPEAMRVSAVWVQQPRSLVNLYETLKVPIEHVFTLYSAAHAIGLAGVGQREVDGLLEPAAIDGSENEGLFGSILRKLTGRAIEA